MKNKVGRPARYNDNQKIVKKVKKNPHRKGTEMHENFKLFRSGMKISLYKAKGGLSRCLRYGVDKGFLEVTGE